MNKFEEWLLIREAGAGVPYVGQDPGSGAGGWQGSPSGGKLRSVGDVKIKKKRRSWKQIGEEYTQKYGKNHHCLKLECEVCGNHFTCRCIEPKITEVGICEKCLAEMDMPTEGVWNPNPIYKKMTVELMKQGWVMYYDGDRFGGICTLASPNGDTQSVDMNVPLLMRIKDEIEPSVEAKRIFVAARPSLADQPESNFYILAGKE